ncbi:uncharacterized protein VTP21DRAFT_4198 [Calcarisporiella thermophila]|uniref:uncharacterized protein n=1 Tax=Calcarisporiella thermophila TaxID=911321 RepID=UPI0037447383
MPSHVFPKDDHLTPIRLQQALLKFLLLLLSHATAQHPSELSAHQPSPRLANWFFACSLTDLLTLRASQLFIQLLNKSRTVSTQNAAAIAALASQYPGTKHATHPAATTPDPTHLFETFACGGAYLLAMHPAC